MAVPSLVITHSLSLLVLGYLPLVPVRQEVGVWNASITSARPDIQINKAWLNIKSLLPDGESVLYVQTEDCVQCPLWKEKSIPASGAVSVLVATQAETSLAVTDANNNVMCSGKHGFEERGDYWLVVSPPNETAGNHTCTLSLANTPPNIYMPLLWAALFLILLAVTYVIVSKLHTAGYMDRCRPGYQSQDLPHTNIELQSVANGKPSTSHCEATQNGTCTTKGTPDSAHVETPAVDPPIPAPRQPGRQRVRALDTFRGLSLLVMIFVNYGGGRYYFFQHATWNGLMVADLVFPWFIFIMGTSMEFAFISMAKRNTPKWKVAWKIFRRSALLFLIGISLTTMWGNDLRKLRIPGVLQRFALSYLFVGITHMFFVKTPTEKQNGGLFVDVLSHWFEWSVMLCLLTLHLGFTFGLPVPGCPTGYLGPGGLDDGGAHYNCTGGAAGYIDKMILGDVHIFQWPTIRAVYHKAHAVPFDPEGILGCLTSIFMCFLGLQAGKILKSYSSHQGRLLRWCIWGVVCTVIGLVLCKARQDGGWIPLNKNLWSVSFIFLLSGMAFLLLAAMYVIIDVKQIWNGAPLVFLGMNSLVVYCCHEIFHGYFPVRWQMPDQSEHWQELFMAMWGTAVWTLMAYVLYAKKIFVAL